MIADFPRTLLIDLGGPNARYKPTAKIVSQLPPDRIFWASFWGEDAGGFRGFSGVFGANPVHWRLKDTSFGFIWSHEIAARMVARRIADAVSDFGPELVWVIPETGAAKVGLLVSQKLGVRSHITLHDACETASDQVPRGYCPFFRRAYVALLRHASSVDSISQALLEHELRRCRTDDVPEGMVFPPSVPREWLVRTPRPRSFGGDARRRIGLCGSMRVSGEQWGRFVALLGQLGCPVEIIAVAYRDMFYDLELPENVQIVFHDFLGSERDVISLFDKKGVHACYLGLWRESGQSLFGRTSLSSKLTTYLAAAVPVIVDAADDSVAATLVRQHGAGILLSGEFARDVEVLQALLSNEKSWQGSSSGASRLLEHHMIMERNIPKFIELLRDAGEGGHAK